jgi:hypothetical protein
MFRILVLIISVFIIGLSSEVYAQDAGARAQTLAAALDKNKYKKKEKHNISIETYVDIKNEPVVKGNPADYSGRYSADDYKLELKVDANGSAEGSGYDLRNAEGDRWPKMKFALRDARVEGALLTGTKVFENGQTEAFEAVFANRTVTSGKNAETINSRNTSFGIGFIQANKDWTNRAFLEKID